MRIYLDVSCLNRPSDDQRQTRIRLEAEAVTLIFERIDTGDWIHTASDMMVVEVNAGTDPEKRRRAKALLPTPSKIVPLTEAIWSRASECQAMGFKPGDAVHVADAEATTSDVLLTCDDRMIRAGRRNRHRLRVRIANPLSWLQEQNDDPNT